MVGRKLLYLYGFAVFIIGSALCGLAPSLGALDGFRVLQGVGAAMLQANSVAIIAVATPFSRLGRAIGIQGAAQAIGLALGPTIGGLLLSAGGWRLIFFVNVPFGVVGMLAGWLFIPRSRSLSPRHPFDWVGLGLFLPAVGALLGAISFGNELGWTSAAVLGALCGGLILAVLFIVRERRVDSPMLDLSLFRNARFSAGVVSGLLSYLVLFGTLFVVPFLLERSAQVSPARAGLELMAMPVTLGLVAPFAGKLADRIGARTLTVGGALLSAAGLVVMGLLPDSTVALLVGLVIVGAGMGAFTPPNNAAIMGSAPRRQAGLASGVLNMARGLGTSLGLACAGLVLGLAGGESVSAAPAAVRHAFSVTIFSLAGVAVAAAVVASLRRSGSLESDPTLTAE
jgi:EmrB/QacA subfamily drug resistance transporter